MKNRRRVLIISVVLTVVAAACSSAGDDDAHSGDTTTIPATATEPLTPGTSVENRSTTTTPRVTTTTTEPGAADATGADDEDTTGGAATAPGTATDTAADTDTTAPATTAPDGAADAATPTATKAPNTTASATTADAAIPPAAAPDTTPPATAPTTTATPATTLPTATAGPAAPPDTTAPPKTTAPGQQWSEGSVPDGGVPDGGVPDGLVTPTGVPVAVLGRSDSGYLVRTPCGNTAEVSEGVHINDTAVVIDPGHGGPVDTGAVGPNGLIERDLNLTLGLAVVDELNSRGISAVSTRTGVYPTLLSVRSLFADDLGVEALVSIHHNAPTWALGSTPGSEVFIQSASTGLPRADSARLGGLLYEEITAALASFDNVTWSRAAGAGVLRVLSSQGDDAYGMIVRPQVPTALVEYGYLSNPSEAALFATDEYIEVAARATADAIDAYLHTDRPGTGFIQRPRIFDPQRAPSFCEDPVLE